MPLRKALAYHDTPNSEPANDEANDEPATESYQRRYEHLCARFPEYGYYSVADPSATLDQEIVLNDAIDDLADLVRDLDETVWRFEYFGADEANWHFRFSYQIH